MAEHSRDAEFLTKVYKNAKMAADSIVTVTSKVTDSNLLSDLKDQHSQYESISAKATTNLAKENILPKEKNIASQTAVWSGIQMNTMFDKSPDHIAELMIQGSVMGIIDMTRTIREYDDISDNIKNIGYDLVTAEEKNLQRMKNYLG